MDITLLITFVIFSYLLGSVPSGLIISKLGGKGDIRKIGSGNIGATNVLRTGSKKLAAITLLTDAGKGAIAASFFHFFFMSTPVGEAHVLIFFSLVFGLAAILGHCFPIWLKFKGGKGVATAFGVLLATVPFAALVSAVTWAVVAGFSRISSLSALCACAIAPLATFLIYGLYPAIVTLLISLLVIARHKDNIKRLVKGDESKIGAKKKDVKDDIIAD